jgi:hypothetical protein
LIAVAGIVLFGFAALKYIQALKRQRKRRQP